MMETMKAVQIHEYGGPEVLKYEDVPRPQPEPGEILIRIHAAGVNPIDWKIREGYLKDRVTLPMILGRDFSGVVYTIGSDVSKFKEGDEVYGLARFSGPGSYAEYTVVGESDMALKPRSLDFIHASGIPLAVTAAWQALFDTANLSAGQTVLIHGAAGGVGHYATQLAKWKGAKVIGTALGSDVDFVRELGTDKAIDVKKTRFEDVVHDVDVVLDLIGRDTQERSWQVLKKGGILVSTVGIQSPDAPDKYGVRGVGLVARTDPEELAKIAELIDEGHVKPAVQTVFPLSEAAKAHELLQSGTVHGKVVLKVRD